MIDSAVTSTTKSYRRYVDATRAAGIHFLLSLMVAVAVALFVFSIWYPFPYSDFSGGRELFLLVVAVDVVCGPILTLVLFDRLKSRSELLCDLSLIAILQLAALGYGLWSVHEARPLFLVWEIDRFKVMAMPDFRPAAHEELILLPSPLSPTLISEPIVVALREPKNELERQKVLLESVAGGRDYAERPAFYIPYKNAPVSKLLLRAKSLPVFLQKQPDQLAKAQKLATEKNVDLSQLMYLPVIARQDWVAVLDKQGQIQGFLKGDGF